MPFEKFSVKDNWEDTLKSWQRKLEYLFNKNLNDDNITSTSLTLGSAQVKASNIDFGTGANQVDASDIPTIDAGGYFTGANVELALQQLGSTFQNIPTTNLDGVFTTPLELQTTNIVLNHSTLNMKVNASSQLDTIQNIATTDSPTFANMTITSTIQAGTAKFGNSSDYSEFEPDGTLVFKGNATLFDDMNGSVLELQTIGVGLSKNAVENTLDFTTGADLSDYAYDNYQFSHKRKNGSNVYPHAHWVQKENATPNLLMRYRWQVNGQPHTTTWTDYPMTNLAFPYVSGSLNQISYGPAVSSPTTGDLSCLMQIRLYRDGDNNSGAFASTGAYSTTLNIMFVDIHYEADTPSGSRQEYVK